MSESRVMIAREARGCLACEKDLVASLSRARSMCGVRRGSGGNIEPPSSGVIAIVKATYGCWSLMRAEVWCYNMRIRVWEMIMFNEWLKAGNGIAL